MPKSKLRIFYINIFHVGREKTEKDIAKTACRVKMQQFIKFDLNFLSISINYTTKY